MEKRMNVRERIENAFKQISKRSTQPRQIILEKLVQLAETGAVFTGEALWQELRQANPEIGRATVFRSIDKLVELKVLDRIDFEDGGHYFRVCSAAGHHHHLACTECRRVVEFEHCIAEEQIDAIAKQANFAIDDHVLTIFGCCEDCQKRRKS